MKGLYVYDIELRKVRGELGPNTGGEEDSATWHSAKRSVGLQGEEAGYAGPHSGPARRNGRPRGR